MISKTLESIVKNEFYIECRKFWNSDFIEKIWEVLLDNYSQKIRYYHNMNHIINMIKFYDNYKKKINDYSSIFLATWFHDVVYNPKKDDNETKSSNLFRNLIKGSGLSEEIIDKICGYILFTKNHENFEDNEDLKIFLDSDLFILGSKESEYTRYAMAIRAEYFHVKNEDYFFGRKRILEKFLEKERIFYTNYAFRKFEKQARKNMKIELGLMGKL